jgi:adenine-specific DNA-methyltransferase
MIDLRLGDCLEVLKTLPENSVDAVVTDPPYFRVKDAAWDRQWADREKFLAWVAELCQQWQRVLKPNGSLYVFASPQMAAHVEVTVGRFFEVLNHLVWAKGNTGWRRRACKETLRTWFPESERIIFAEHFGADSYAKGEAGYERKCDEARGFVFEPLRAYLAGEVEAAGHTAASVDKAWQAYRNSKGHMVGHWLSRSQWELPTATNYEWLRGVLNADGGEYLRREYEDLRREYEDLRRPFAVTAQTQYTDVWRFDTVPHRPGKHVCEKPVALMRHIIQHSTRPGDVVLDCFAGSGSTGAACVELGRSFIGIEIDPVWHANAVERLNPAQSFLEGLK